MFSSILLAFKDWKAIAVVVLILGIVAGAFVEEHRIHDAQAATKTLQGQFDTLNEQMGAQKALLATSQSDNQNLTAQLDAQSSAVQDLKDRAATALKAHNDAMAVASKQQAASASRIAALNAKISQLNSKETCKDAITNWTGAPDVPDGL